MVGNFGSCEVFSFHATKFINCFEGGAVVTNDDALAAKMRLMRNFGFSGYDKRDLSRNQRQNDRGLRGNGINLAGGDGRNHCGEPTKL